ncbi:hypothetical protein D3C87_1192090 [compost metagenome]
MNLHEHPKKIRTDPQRTNRGVLSSILHQLHRYVMKNFGSIRFSLRKTLPKFLILLSNHRLVLATKLGRV